MIFTMHQLMYAEILGIKPVRYFGGVLVVVFF